MSNHFIINIHHDYFRATQHEIIYSAYISQIDNLKVIYYYFLLLQIMYISIYFCMIYRNHYSIGTSTIEYPGYEVQGTIIYLASQFNIKAWHLS